MYFCHTLCLYELCWLHLTFSSVSIKDNVGTAEQGDVQLEKARDYQASFASFFICVKCYRSSVHRGVAMDGVQEVPHPETFSFSANLQCLFHYPVLGIIIVSLR